MAKENILAKKTYQFSIRIINAENICVKLIMTMFFPNNFYVVAPL